MKESEKELWDSLNDAEMNALYYGYMARRYSNLEKGTLVFSAIMSTAAIGSLQIWKSEWLGLDWSHCWDALSLFAVLVAVGAPLVNFGQTAQKCASLRPVFLNYRNQYNELWLNRSSFQDRTLIMKLTHLKEAEIRDTVIDSTIKRDIKLLKKCQEEIIKSKGL